MQSDTMELSDGRVLSWSELGSTDSANVLVHHHGTGSSRLELQIYDELLAEMGVRVVAPERPGSGCSTGGEQPRTVAVWADDIVRLVEQLGIDEFAVGGFSGGGPHALAVAASPELATRVTRVLLRASLAPGQPPRNDYDVEIRARAHRIPWSDFVEWFEPTEPPDLAPADLEAFSDAAYAKAGLATVAEGRRQGVLGDAGDHWAFAGPWGFDVRDVEQPVDIAHGDDDRNVPVFHAEVLGDLLPNVTVRVLPGEGHYSIGRHVPAQVAFVLGDQRRD
jgi:pimeloyl-ACP methyl ester carboxylesterase